MLKLFLLFLLTRAMEFGTVAKHYILGVNVQIMLPVCKIFVTFTITFGTMNDNLRRSFRGLVS